MELEKSFQEWCDTWGPFRSRRVSDRVEDLRPRAVRERFSLTGTTPRRRPGTGYLLNYLINYLISRFQVDFPYLRLRGDRKGFPSKRDLLGCLNMLNTK